MMMPSKVRYHVALLLLVVSTALSGCGTATGAQVASGLEPATRGGRAAPPAILVASSSRPPAAATTGAAVPPAVAEASSQIPVVVVSDTNGYGVWSRKAPS